MAEPQASWAVAMPVCATVVSAAGSSRIRSDGLLSAGGVVSLTVIRGTQLLWLPQLSVAVQVRSITLTMAPGSVGGCCGSGPNGGCCCGGGRGKIFERF